MNNIKYILLLLTSINLSSGNLFNEYKLIDMRSDDFDLFLKNYEKRLSIMIQAGIDKEYLKHEKERLNLIIEHNQTKKDILYCNNGSSMQIINQKPCKKNIKNINQIQLLLNETNLIKVD